MLEEVRSLVKKASVEQDKIYQADWKYHISLVVKYSKLLAERTGADVKLAELGALLHDIGRIRFGPENHEITGANEAEKILKELNCPKETIAEIRHCVESHRGSGTARPRTKVAQIIANADAMAHFDAIPFLLQVALKNENGDLEKAVSWLHDKIERDWNKKLTLPEAKEMMKEKYEAIRLLLGATVECSK